MRYRFIIVACFSVIFMSLRMQAYTINDDGRYHCSSVYYLTLSGEDGLNISSQYAANTGAVGAFINDELRGVSEPLNTPDGMVLMLRVWGAEEDGQATQVHFRLQSGLLEYELGIMSFAAGGQGDATFGQPSSPIAIDFRPLIGISLSTSNVSVLAGRSQLVEAKLQPVDHTEVLTPIPFLFRSSDDNIFSVESEGNSCRIKGLKRGTGTLSVQAMVGATVLHETSVLVSVLTESVPVTSIRNDMPSETIETMPGMEFKLAYTVLPENASNREVYFILGDATLLYYITDDYGQTTFHAVKSGKTTITVVSVDNEQITQTYTVVIKEQKAPVFGFTQSVFTLSKLRDATITLTADGYYAPELLELVVDSVKTGIPAITIIGNDATRLQWSLRGLFVGQYQAHIRYDGRLQEAVCRVDIPAEIGFDNGWDWVSIFVPNSYVLVDEKTGVWASALNIDDNNKVIEIRSQHSAVFNDEKLGLFGDITHLTAADGFYKIKSNYDNDHAVAKVFNFGMTADGKAVSAMMPDVNYGYTWIGYPHEQNHALSTLQPYLSETATEGDMIIGRDAFLEFDGDKWVGSLKMFEFGKGYIYYTENEKPFHLNWGDYYLPTESVVAPVQAQPWLYDARQYVGSMPVVAMITGIFDTNRYSLGAFVGDECRGYGVPDIDCENRWFMSVTGNTGDIVYFRLYDNLTGGYIDLDEHVPFGTAVGSLRNPFKINGMPAGIQTTSVESLALAYHNESIIVNGNTAPVTINVRNMSGRVVLTSTSTVTRTDCLPSGVYVVTVSDGNTRKSLKITK